MSYYNELRRVVQASAQDAKKRKKEKQAQALEKGVENPFEKLIIEGRAAVVNRDNKTALLVESSLVPCHGRSDTMIDRFDGRALLEMLPKDSEADFNEERYIELGDYKLDSFLCYERYRDLIEAAKKGKDSKQVLKNVAYEVRLRLQKGFGSETAEEVQKRGEKMERERAKEAVREEKRRKEQALADSIAAAAAGVSGHYGPVAGHSYEQLYAEPPTRGTAELQEVKEANEESNIDILTPKEVEDLAVEYGINASVPNKVYSYAVLDLYNKKQEQLEAEPEQVSGSKKERRRYRRYDDYRDSFSDTSDEAEGHNLREFRDPLMPEYEIDDSDSDSGCRRKYNQEGNQEEIQYISSFDTAAESSGAPAKQHSKQEESALTHMQLLDGLFPSVGNAVRSEEARIKKRLKKRREVREKQELLQWRARRNRSRSFDRFKRNVDDETEESLPEPPPDPKKSAAVAITAAKVAGKKLTPAELVKVRMRHMMQATIQQDKHDNKRKKEAAVKAAELELQAQKAATELRKSNRKSARSDARSRSTSRSMSMSISSGSSPEHSRKRLSSENEADGGRKLPYSIPRRSDSSISRREISGNEPRGRSSSSASGDNRRSNRYRCRHSRTRRRQSHSSSSRTHRRHRSRSISSSSMRRERRRKIRRRSDSRRRR